MADPADSELPLTAAPFAWFLKGWEYEIRSGHTPASELEEECSERFIFIFPNAFTQHTERRLLEELRGWTSAFIASERAAESGWAEPTVNDRVAAALRGLREARITTSDFGCTLHDAWGYAGLNKQPGDLGAVVYSDLDALDVLEGDELLIAFGSFDGHTGRSERIGRMAWEALNRAGVSTRWSGDARDRIRVPRFEWRRRRWTASPAIAGPPGEHRYDGAERDAMRVVPAAFVGEALREYCQPVTAVRSSAGFRLELTATYKQLWRNQGGRRGQMCHHGLPHVFVPAGQQTTMAVRNAYLNLDPLEMQAIVGRASAAQGKPDV